MPLYNKLSLREAIVIALINQPIRRVHLNNIFKYIKERGLYYPERNCPSFYNELNSFYQELGDENSILLNDVGAGYIELKDTNVNFPLQFVAAYEAVVNHFNPFFQPKEMFLNVIDVQLKTQRKINITPNNVVCIVAFDLKHKKSGDKKFIYLRELDLQAAETIGIYSIHGSLESLQNQIDPLNYYLCIISDNILVNVAFYNLSKYKNVIPSHADKVITSLPKFKFSESKAAKIYKKNFELMQLHYIDHISLKNNLLKLKSGL